MSILHLPAAPAPLHIAAADIAAAAGYDVGSGRFVPTAAAVVALGGVVIGALALARANRRSGPGNGRRGAVVALALGLVSAGVAGVHMANSAGGLGTGNGLAGAIIALTLSLSGMAVGGLALARSRHTDTSGPDAHGRR
jgi:hypothetical protein